MFAGCGLGLGLHELTKDCRFVTVFWCVCCLCFFDCLVLFWVGW